MYRVKPDANGQPSKAAGIPFKARAAAWTYAAALAARTGRPVWITGGPQPVVVGELG